MSEEYDWLGGQLTSQAVPPEEHSWVEQFGVTHSYRQFGNGIRQYYRDHYPLTVESRARGNLNPGAGRVSRLCAEPLGEPLDLYDRPTNLFGAGFIGSPAMNMIGGRITVEGFVAAGVALPLPTRRGLPTTPSGIRPEHLSLADAGIPAVVKLVGPVGSETQVTMTLGEHTIIGVCRERLQARPGETVYLTADLSSVHLFDIVTSGRLN